MPFEAATQTQASRNTSAGSAHNIDIASSDLIDECWYVVHTQPHAKSRAIAHLERQGFFVFLSAYAQDGASRPQGYAHSRPMFPNYLFVRLDVSRDRWRSVHGTCGVIRLITHGETPQPIPVGIVEALQACISIDGTLNWMPLIKIGQAVCIADGPFADFVGMLEYLDAAGWLHVLLDMLGRSVSVALRCEALASAA